MLTSTDRTILEIASDAGLPTLSNFNRLFKAKFQQSPRDYRRKYALHPCHSRSILRAASMRIDSVAVDVILQVVS
jgi:AraC-like DNA-binding protein